MENEHFVEEVGVSLAWGRALKKVARVGKKELAPLTVAITGDNTEETLQEDPNIRQALDRLLGAQGCQSVETVANTIFPYSLWNSARPRSDLFERYETIVDRIRKANRQNQHGVYFDRMINNGPASAENQLDFGLRTYSARKGVRRSVLQVGVFDPRQDHSTAALRGFPCLQHLSFVPVGSGRLSVNAFYATQFMVSRAYGNYLGICRLGQFVAHELNLSLTRVSCHVGLAELDMSKSKLEAVVTAISAALNENER